MSTRMVSLGLAASALLVTSAARADPAREEGQHFTVDPIVDTAVTVSSAGSAFMLSLILTSGEITPEPPGPLSNLVSFDRAAAQQTPSTNAATLSDIGLYGAIGFAVLDPVLSGFRDGWDAAIVDATLYAESASVTELLTDVFKIAVRRPRPIDYLRCQGTEGAATTPPGCASTNLTLSFFSGHTSTVATLGATATYLAFARSPHSPRPWITLGLATALTAFVGYERVASGDHFPTDVITGALVGGAVGLLVPHLHRHSEEPPPVILGVAPSPGGGGSVTLGGAF